MFCMCICLCCICASLTGECCSKPERAGGRERPSSLWGFSLGHSHDKTQRPSNKWGVICCQLVQVTTRSWSYNAMKAVSSEKNEPVQNHRICVHDNQEGIRHLPSAGIGLHSLFRHCPTTVNEGHQRIDVLLVPQSLKFMVFTDQGHRFPRSPMGVRKSK